MNSSKEYDSVNYSDFDKFVVSEKIQEILVLDSSVIFKWFYFEKEESIFEAQNLYYKATSEASIILTPELTIYELLSIFRFRTDMKPEKLEEIIKTIFDIITVIKLDYAVYLKAYEISQLTGCSIYDSIYIAISEKLKTQFITADEKLFSRVKQYNYNIVLLNEYLSE